MSSIDLWKFLAGLGLFLYGISLMEQVTKKAAGRSFKLFLRNHTKSLSKAIFGGTLITGLIQSSSVVILMLMSFAGAGVISFRNALGVLIGSNLGTTVDSWFYATIGFKFNLQFYSMPFIAIAAIAMFFTEKRLKLYNTLYVIFSIGILLLGLGFMKDGAEQLVVQLNMAAYANYNLIFILCIGFVITVLIQSSSATVVITLTALNAHALTFPAATCMIIGSEVGTTIKFLVSSIKGSPERKMLAWGDFIFNVFTAIISFSFLGWIIIFIRDIVGVRDPLTGLVFFQSFINLLSIIIFLPFIKRFSRWLEKIFRKEKQGTETSFYKDQPAIPELAPFVLQKAGFDILNRVIDFHKKIFGPGLQATSNGFLPKIKSFTRQYGTTDWEYSRIKETEGDILKYYSGIQKDELSKEDYKKLNQYLSAIRQSLHAAKSVHDIRHNLNTFQSSADNYLFQQYTFLQHDWNDFETGLRHLLEEEKDDNIRSGLERSMVLAFKQFEFQKNGIEEPLGSHELDEIGASTLLNVYQEILSCKKALLRALSLLKIYSNETGNSGESSL